MHLASIAALNSISEINGIADIHSRDVHHDRMKLQRVDQHYGRQYVICIPMQAITGLPWFVSLVIIGSGTNGSV